MAKRGRKGAFTDHDLWKVVELTSEYGYSVRDACRMVCNELQGKAKHESLRRLYSRRKHSGTLPTEDPWPDFINEAVPRLVSYFDGNLAAIREREGRKQKLATELGISPAMVSGDGLLKLESRREVLEAQVFRPHHKVFELRGQGVSEAEILAKLQELKDEHDQVTKQAAAIRFFLKNP